MPHELSDLFAELDAAKANLQRSVRRSRAFLADHRLPPDPAADRRLFGWREEG